MYLLWFLLSLLSAFLAKYFFDNYRFYKFAFQFPREIPYIPNFLMGYFRVFTNKYDLYQTLRHMKGSDQVEILAVWLPWLSVVLRKVDHFQPFFSSKHLLEKNCHYAGVSYFMGETNDGLISVSGDEFPKCKKRFYQMFNNSSEDIIFSSIVRGVDPLLRDLEKHVEKGFFKMSHVATKASVRNVMDGVMDQLVSYDSPIITLMDSKLEEMEFNLVAHGIASDFPFSEKLFPFKRNLHTLRSEVHDVWRPLFNKKRTEYLAMNKQAPNQFIYNLIREVEQDPTIDIFAEMSTVMFGAAGTTSTSIASCLVMLAMHPEAQERVYLEDQLVQKELQKQKREFSDSDLDKYEYLHRVLKETLRLYPSIPMFSRSVKEELVVGDYTLPKGSIGCVFVPYVHRDPDIYPNPTKFDPDRFLPEEVEKRNKFAFLPFSYGQRRCPGMRYATQSTVFYVSTIIRNYKVFTRYKTMTELDDNLRGCVALVDVEGFPIRLEKRTVAQ